MPTINNLEILPKYISELTEAYGIQVAIEKTEFHLKVAQIVNASESAIEFLNMVRNELNKIKENKNAD
jgi:hypothetical protein